jgi:hypothetical protein
MVVAVTEFVSDVLSFVSLGSNDSVLNEPASLLVSALLNLSRPTSYLPWFSGSVDKPAFIVFPPLSIITTGVCIDPGRRKHRMFGRAQDEFKIIRQHPVYSID